MKLYINNERRKIIRISENEVLRKFKYSDYAERRDMALSVRLALFIASPSGFNSTFEGEEFKEVLEDYTINKHKI